MAKRDHTPPDRSLTPAETADLFGVDPRTVNRWVHEGKLPARRTPGGHLRFDRAEMERIFAASAPSSSVPPSDFERTRP